MRKDDIMELGAYFKSIIDQDRAAVVICSLDHKIIYMNPAAAANYHKYGGAELLGKSLLDCHGAHSNDDGAYHGRHEKGKTDRRKTDESGAAGYDG